MTTYTALTIDGEVLARGLTLAEAAAAIRSDPAAEFKVLPMNHGGNQLAWRPRGGSATDWHDLPVYALDKNINRASRAIFARFAQRADDFSWDAAPMVLPDSAYDDFLLDAAES